MLKWLDRIEDYVSGSLLILSAIVAFVQTVLRYVFNIGWVGSTEFLTTALIWSALIGAAVGVRHGVHIGVDAIIEQFNPKLLKGIIIFNLVLSGVFCATYLYYGIKFVSFIFSIGRLTEEMRIPAWIPYLILPICYGLMALRFFQQFLQKINTPADKIKKEKKGAH